MSKAIKFTGCFAFQHYSTQCTECMTVIPTLTYIPTLTQALPWQGTQCQMHLFPVDNCIMLAAGRHLYGLRCGGRCSMSVTVHHAVERIFE